MVTMFLMYLESTSKLCADDLYIGTVIIDLVGIVSHAILIYVLVNPC